MERTDWERAWNDWLSGRFLGSTNTSPAEVDWLVLRRECGNEVPIYPLKGHIYIYIYIHIYIYRAQLDSLLPC